MGVEEHLCGEVFLRRIAEGVAVTVLGGLILWLVTGTAPRITPRTDVMVGATAPPLPPAAPPGGNWESPILATTASPFPTAAANTVTSFNRPPVASTTVPAPQPAATTARMPVAAWMSAPPTAAIVNPSPAIPAAPNGPARAASTTRPLPQPAAASVRTASFVLYEDFSHYREGDATNWGPSTFVKTGLDRRYWLVSNVDGAHPVGCRVPLPNKFDFQCRYSANLPEVTAGATGWWKEPVATSVAFMDGQGAKCTVRWAVKYGNEPTLLNPLGTPLLAAKKYYHCFSLPDGTNGIVAGVQPTGVLQIHRDNNALKVLVDGQLAAVGNMRPMGPLVGFEIDVVKARNGSLFFTDFKIAR
jgi:hypothetical protein